LRLQDTPITSATRARTIIEASGDEADIDIEDMIADEDMVITMTHGGYVKRSSVTTYRTQARGGKGVLGMESKDDDFIESLFVASTHAYILFFTNAGRCYWLKVYKIPEAGRHSRGRPIINLVQLKEGERIAAMVPVREFDNDHFILVATEQGVINKQPLSAYSNLRRDGVNAINLDEGDRVIECKLTAGDNDIILATKGGQAVRFHESAARELGRHTRGVRGITLRNDDRVVGMIIVNETDDVLTITENGYGKRTPVTEYRKTNRGGSGIINIKVTEKNGPVVALKGIYRDGDAMLITRNGVIIRCPADRISVIGRNTQGIRLIALDDGDMLIDVAMAEKEEEMPEIIETAPSDTAEAAPEVREPGEESGKESDQAPEPPVNE